MTAKAIATRAEAIDAAIDKFAGDSYLEHWVDDEYVRGICEVIADTFGADVDDHDHDQVKDAIWDEICAAFVAKQKREEAERLQTKAEAIAREYVAPFEHETDPRGRDLYAPILAAATAVARAALTEKEN